MSSTHRHNLARLLLAPLAAARFLLAITWMAVTAPVLFAAVILVMLPAELAWLASAFVGVASPAAGTKMADIMEPAMDRLEATIDTIWKPIEWLFP